jgi:transposase-like protein/IS1 family transposase
MQKAPISALTLAGATIRTAEAAQTRNLSIRLLAVNLNRRFTMTCHNCRIEAAKAGKRPDGMQRYRCGTCGKTFSQAKDFGVFGHKQLDEASALLALKLLVEGNSIRSTQRISGLDKKTIMKLLLDAGEKCSALLTAKVRNVPVMDVQADEIWGFVGKKEGHKNPFKGDDMYVGDAWCFIGIERHTKLVLAFELGKRTETSTNRFMQKLAKATHPDQPFQLTTDGLATYPSAVYRALGDRVDYAQHIKIYGQTPEGERRYSPAKVIGAEKKDIYGDPDTQRICTSHIERQNGSLRQWCKRLTRLTYAFSKKWAHLKAALGLHFAYYNFCRVHSTIKQTPAMASGLATRAWALAELLA